MYKPESQKGTFLEQTKAAREERALEKKRDSAAVIIQARVRGWLMRCRFRYLILEQFDNEMKIINEVVKVTDLKPSLHMYRIIQRFLLVWNKERDKDRFYLLCRYLVVSLEAETARTSYIGVALCKEQAILWIAHIKDILWKCCECLDDLRPDVPADVKNIMILLHTLVAFTATNTWALLRTPNMAPLRAGMTQLCANIIGHLFMRGFYITLKAQLMRGLARPKVCLKHASLSAILSLATRPLILTNLSDKLVFMFLTHIFSVPAVVKHMHSIAPECVGALETCEFLHRALELLHGEQDMRIVFNTLEGNYALCLLANLIHLAYLQRDSAFKGVLLEKFVTVATELMESCQNYVSTNQSKLSYWHPVLGWFSQPMDMGLQDSISCVKDQLFLLWSQPLVAALLGSALDEALHNSPDKPPHSGPSITSNIFKKALELRANMNTAARQQRHPLGGPESSNVALVCTLYYSAMETLTQLRLDILTGFCSQNQILYQMWKFLNTLGLQCGMKSFLNLRSVINNDFFPQFNILILFSECMTHYLTLLDDVEMYEQQKPFTLNDYISMSRFLNRFLFTFIMTGHYVDEPTHANELFHTCHTLLMVLYRRDTRRSYTNSRHWIVKELRTCVFFYELEKGKKCNQLLLRWMPHVIPHMERVQLFRKYVADEKSSLALSNLPCLHKFPRTLITVHRNRIVEDGYRQLALLPPRALKGVIRVRFINEQGLDEAGIDQDGVFKEFLEETIKRVFNPSLNLFRVTSEEMLYPSPTSYLQDNHLHLFEFIGRMLAKAIYEGIVVDVPFALFFLSQVTGQTQPAFYSCMDELPSLDKDLYRSLTYIKHLPPNSDEVSEMDLNFSVDQDVLGHLVTHELIPGGRAVPVTNQNKFNYIHLMAHFRMHTQIEKQSNAFIRGFRSIIDPDWLSLFSTPELQRLISGDNVPLDLADLRHYTQYYGGFHDSHRVIVWLWDILHRDFSEEERKLFLKFVTSCSKPPLLGFTHLEPLFSIRCVEVGDDEDTGDTIGSVIRGFFTIRKKDPQHRLPTSSTCFNLLKLPNYQRKSTLRDKLRYAISSNTGFELS